MAFKKYWETNPVYGIELMAMRMMRGKSIVQMAKMVKESVYILDKIEKDHHEAPRDIVSVYMEKLSISRSHMQQFKKILKGQLKTFSEDRTISTLVKKQVRSKCNNKCVKCSADKNLHFHHVDRFASGGQNTVDNLFLLCASCHAEEHKGEKGYHMLKKLSEVDK